MNSVEELHDLIRAILADTPAPPDVEIHAQTPLLVSGLLDSLTIMRIVTGIEEATGVTFPETEVVAANFRTPAVLWALVETMRATRPAGNAVRR